MGRKLEERRHPVAITGYTLIAFQAAGNLPGEGPYGRVVKKGMDYLLNQVGADGIYGNRASGQYMYAHGIVTIALAELYGQTRSPAIRGKLDRTIKLIIASQTNRADGGIVRLYVTRMSGNHCRWRPCGPQRIPDR